MGWSFSIVMAGKGSLPLKGSPQHLPEKAREIYSYLEPHRFDSSRFSTFEMALSPKPGWISIGAYDRGAVLAGFRGQVGCAEEPSCSFAQKCVQFFQGYEVLLYERSAVTDYTAFARFDDGRLVQTFVSEAGRPATTWSPVDGSKHPNIQRSEREGLGFQEAARFLGTRLDRFDFRELVVEEFRPVGLSWFVARLLGQ